MTKIKKAWDSYRQLGSNTRLIIKIALIMFFTVFLTAIYTVTATGSKYYYELLLLTDDLISCSKSICGTGFICILVTGIAEGTLKHSH